MSTRKTQEIELLRRLAESGQGHLFRADLKKDPIWVVDVELSFEAGKQMQRPRFSFDDIKKMCELSEPE